MFTFRRGSAIEPNLVAEEIIAGRVLVNGLPSSPAGRKVKPSDTVARTACYTGAEIDPRYK